MIELNRAKAVDENFTNKTLSGDLPQPHVNLTPEDAGLTSDEVIDLFESQIISRHLDLAARLLRARNQGFYTIGSCGHEGNAAFGKVFRYTDMAFLHYRSGGFVVQRSKQLPGSTVLYDSLLSFAASSEDPIAGGRHKVWGSVPLFIPPQTSTIASHLPKSVGAALSIPRARQLGLDGKLPHDSVVICTFGDASANHSTSLGALNAARWCAHRGVPLPLVFICEDNTLGISVQTPADWIAIAHGHCPDMAYFPCDGRSLPDVYRCAVEVEDYVRTQLKPAFVHMKTVRLLGHAGSDVETMYHTENAILQAEADDPLLHSARLVIEQGYLKPAEVVELYETIRRRTLRVAEQAIKRPKLRSAQEVMASIVPPKLQVQPPPYPSAQARAKVFSEHEAQMEKPQHMARLINWALHDLLLQYPQMLVFGEDVGRKGGVYNVTVGLQKKFGVRRVFDTLLDEQTILGSGIGLAHNGFLPVPEIQFLAYVHNAEDQIRGEASTLSFFSNGQYANPMVVRIAGLAYQKGFGGHFHNDNSLNIFRDIPGLIVAVPSNGADAARMLRRCMAAAYLEQRVAVFIEPIALYMTKDLHQAGDGLWQFQYPAPQEQIELGELGVFGQSQELAIVTYGNGYYLSRQAAKILEDKHRLPVKVVDLRWIAPLDESAILKAVEGCRCVLIVDECRRTGSLGEGLFTLFVEKSVRLPRLKRVTAEDCFIPLGDASTLTLPSRDGIVQAALELVKAK